IFHKVLLILQYSCYFVFLVPKKCLITCGVNIQTPNDLNRFIWGLNSATFEIIINYSLYAKQKRKNHNSIFKDYIANCTLYNKQCRLIIINIKLKKDVFTKTKNSKVFLSSNP